MKKVETRVIVNKTQKKVIVKNEILCKNNFSKARGLMFRLRPKNLVFVFEKEKIVPLHMMFVFFPIDVIYLNKNKAVVEMKEKFLPFTLFTPRKKAKYVIELPVGTINKSSIKIGNKLSF